MSEVISTWALFRSQGFVRLDAETQWKTNVYHPDIFNDEVEAYAAYDEAIERGEDVYLTKVVGI